MSLLLNCFIAKLLSRYRILPQYAVRNTQYQKLPFLILLLFSSSVFAQQLKIIEKPIIFDATRTRLSLDYLRERYHLIQKTPTITPIIIVLHWTASKTMTSTYHAFNKSTLPSSRKALVNASSLNVSSHYLVDRDGTIYRLLPDTIFARHTIGLNYCAIGIENVGSDNYPLTKAQLFANEKLVRYLSKKYNIQYLIGHYEYTLFRNTSLWKETNSSYHTQKTDPGRSFMRNIRAELQDLKLKGAPTKK